MNEQLKNELHTFRSYRKTVGTHKIYINATLLLHKYKHLCTKTATQYRIDKFKS